ncbi:MAG: hypothetical protein IH897_10175 [Planctomycetes bacterium]|nr:hypothetical protein [Planctomycetota bacterium]
MSWLVAEDMWPGLSAQDPPPLKVTDWLRQQGAQVQFAIHGEDGRLGTIWTAYDIDRDSLQRHDLIWIDRFPLDVAPLRMEVNSVFTADGVLDEIDVEIENRQHVILLHGERFHKNFSFTFKAGPIEKAFKIPLADGGFISGGLNPFGQLVDMKVGDRWRMQVFNPIAALLGIGDKFIPTLIEVTGRETIVTPQGSTDCLVVESQNAKAWVDQHGAVLVQELTLPLVGKLRMVRETAYDADARSRAKKESLHAHARQGIQ